MKSLDDDRLVSRDDVYEALVALISDDDPTTALRKTLKLTILLSEVVGDSAAVKQAIEKVRRNDEAK
ncbi:MAG: hypothetical protein AAGC56_04105 [Pseudomonadota bacterium]